MTPNRIHAVAMKWGDRIVTMSRPNRHSDLIRRLAEMGESDAALTGQQGFITERAVFKSRRAALRIAQAAGQVIRKTPPEDELFSEDMW